MKKKIYILYFIGFLVCWPIFYAAELAKLSHDLGNCERHKGFAYGHSGIIAIVWPVGVLFGIPAVTNLYQHGLLFSCGGKDESDHH